MREGCHFDEGESSVFDALTHLPRGQRVLIIKRTCHADWTSIVKRITHKNPSGAVRWQQYKTPNRLVIVWNRYFWKIIIEKENNQRPFAVIRIRFVMKTNSWEGKAPWTQVLLLSSKVERVSVILPIIFSLFFTLAEWNLPFGRRRRTQMTEFRGHPLLDREFHVAKVRIDEHVKVSVCTNL